MPEKSRIQLLADLVSLHKRLADHERAMSRHLQTVDTDPDLEALQNFLAEYRKELRNARKISIALAQNSQRAEQTTKGYEETLALVGTWGSDLIFRVTKEGKITYLSRATAKILGFEPGAWLGRRLGDLLGNPGKVKILARVCQIDSNTDDFPAETWSWKTSSGGTVDLEVHCRTVPHPQTGELEIVGIALAGSVGQESSATPWADQQAWFSCLTHELKQPLTAIVNYTRACSRLLESGNADQAELLEALDLAALQAERAGDLVKNLRRLAIPGELQRSTVRINDLVCESLQLLEAEVRKEAVKVEMSLAESLPVVQADRVQIGQVLHNLLQNAIDALGKTPQEQRRICLTTQWTGTEIEVLIRDGGEGLSPDQRERLFQPFQTTKPHGMGLGLVLSRAIVQAHGGRIGTLPQADPGTTFFFTLPNHHE